MAPEPVEVLLSRVQATRAQVDAFVAKATPREQVARALAGRARLEAIETGMALGLVDVRQATTDYLKCVEDAAVIGT